MRCYSTEDSNLSIEYTLNDEINETTFTIESIVFDINGTVMKTVN